MNDLLERINAVLGDRYRLEREVGSGGVATVYLAQDIKQRRKVAVKVLRPGVSGSVAADRFLREIEIAGGLTHPNIVPLFDSGQVGEFLYLVMPFVKEGSLAQRIEQERQLPIHGAIGLACDVAEALRHAHGRGVMHRDIKPSNILLSGGHALVADFGIARAIRSAAHETITSSGVAVGTPAYMSPEQAAGGGHVDARSDIYGLGCVLYEMLSGEPPFRGATAQVLMARHVSEPPPSLALSRPGAAPELDAIIRTALAKTPADRFASADELLMALRSLQSTVSPPIGYRVVAPGSATGDTAARDRHRKASLLRWSLAGALIVGAVFLAIRYMVRDGGPVLDPNKVVVFPLGDRGGGGTDGAGLALAIVNALVPAEPLRPLDGWERLDPAQRANVDMLTLDSARAISEGAGAARFIIGGVVRQGDSLSVSLAVHDTRGDSLLARESAIGLIGQIDPSQVALRATVKLLPALIDPGRRVDISSVTERRPAAISLWIEGEKQYRLSRFTDALVAYERAIEEDPLLTLAALKGAQAASWENDLGLARRFIDLALERIDVLPKRHANLARGLDDYLAGRADSAVVHMGQALADDADWAEALMAMGEVYLHLMPAEVQPGVTEREYFERAAEIDPGFSPPLIHLAESALREGRLADADAWLSRLADVGIGPEQGRHLDVMRRCVADGPQRVEWADQAQVSLEAVFAAAKELSAGGMQSACAKTAFRTVMQTPGAADAYIWAAFRGLALLLVAEGRYGEAIGAIEASPYSNAPLYFMLGSLAGAPMDAQAEATQAALESIYPAYGSPASASARPMASSNLWLVASWHGLRGDTARVRSVRDTLRERTRATGSELERDLEIAVSARLALIEGDTSAAIGLLRQVRRQSDRQRLTYDIAAGLPAECIELARILLRGSQYAEAIRVASHLDHASPISYLAFVPASLQIRLEAARALRRQDDVQRYTDRLTRLGRGDLVAQSP